MVYGFYYVKDGVEVELENGIDLPEGTQVQYRGKGVSDEFIVELEQETGCGVSEEDDIFNPNQEIKDWDS